MVFDGAQLSLTSYRSEKASSYPSAAFPGFFLGAIDKNTKQPYVILNIGRGR